MKTYISRQTFEVVFYACMKAKTIYTENDNIEVEPCMVIRNLCEDDLEFTDEKSAWDYFKRACETGDKVRVMDNTGSIYFDYY